MFSRPDLIAVDLRIGILTYYNRVDQPNRAFSSIFSLSIVVSAMMRSFSLNVVSMSGILGFSPSRNNRAIVVSAGSRNWPMD